MEAQTQQRKKLTCAGCLQVVMETLFIACSAQKCAKIFHLSCANAAHLNQEQVKRWICPDCGASAKKGGDNTHTPVRLSENITLRKNSKTLSGKNPSPPSTSSESFQELVSEIRLLRQDMAKMQSEFSDRFNVLTAKLQAYDGRIQELVVENTSLKGCVTQLQERLNKHCAESLRSDIEILGLTETPNENPYHLVLTTAMKIGVELDDRDLSFVSRTGQRLNGTHFEKGLPRPLIVSFTRRTKRDEFLKEAKLRRSLESKDIVGSGSERKLFVNERITSDVRRLFRTSRLWAKDHGYKYCWVRNGNIYVRRGEARNGSPPIQVKSNEYLQSLLDKQAPLTSS